MSDRVKPNQCCQLNLFTIQQRFEAIVGEIQLNDSLEKISNRFGSIGTDYERATFLLSLEKSQCYSARLTEPSPTVNSKSSSLSEYWRDYGNQRFREEDYSGAIFSYTRSAMFAADQSEQMALAFANRSAAMFRLAHRDESSLDDKSRDKPNHRLFADCCQDLERAINGSYPEQKQHKLWLRLADAQLQLGRFFEAEQSLLSAVKSVRKTRISHASAVSLLQKVDSTMAEAVKKRVSLLLGQADEYSEHSPILCRQQDFNEMDSSQIPTTCSEWPTESHAYGNNTPELLGGQNSTLTSASSEIKVSRSHERGRMLVALRDLFPGDTVIVEPAYCWTLSTESRKTHCYNCGSPSLAVLPCSTCSEVVFCSEQCCRTGIDTPNQLVHRHSCQLLQQLLHLQPEQQLSWLAVEAVLTAGISRLRLLRSRDYNEGDSGNHHDIIRHREAFELVGHSQNRSVPDLFRRSISALILAKTVVANSTEFCNNIERPHNADTFDKKCISMGRDEIIAETCAAILNFLQSLPCNAHPITEQRNTHCPQKFSKPADEHMDKSSLCDPEVVEVGAGIYPTVSLMNHSCDPNVLRVSHGQRCVVRVIRPVLAGEELLDNYGEHAAIHPVEQRREHLRTQYFFMCECKPCLQNWPLHNQLSLSGSKIKKLKPGEARQLKKSRRRFRLILDSLLNGSVSPQKADMLTMCRHLCLLDRCLTSRPSHEYNECQEAIKLCMFSLGNSNEDSCYDGHISDKSAII